MKTAEVLQRLAVVAAVCLLSRLLQPAPVQAHIHALEAAAKGTLGKASPALAELPTLMSIRAYSTDIAGLAGDLRTHSASDPCGHFGVSQHTLTILCGEGGTVSTEVVIGTSVTMLAGAGSVALEDGAHVVVTGTADAGWRFTGWTGAMSSGESTVAFTLTCDQRLEAHFAQNARTLEVTCSEGGGVTKPGVGCFSYEPGTTVLVEAVADTGYRFACWTGTVVDRKGVANPTLNWTTAVVTEDATLRANFEAIRHFCESWEAAAMGTYMPAKASYIEADKGAWSLEDAIADSRSCGVTPHRAEILKLDSGQALLLTSADSRSQCSDIASVSLTEAGLVNPRFALAIDANTMLSFYEVGQLDHPAMHNPARNCAIPPCFDNVSLLLSDNRGNVLAYVLQRYRDAAANVPNGRFGDTYREILLDPSGIYYRRSLLADLQTIPAFDARGAQVRSIEFRVDEHGSAIIDEVTIQPGMTDGKVPVYRFWSPVLECHFFTAGADEKQNLIDLFSETWTFEGIAYFAMADGRSPGATPVYRFWSPVLSSHFYTIDKAEKDTLVRDFSDTWRLDGVSFYAYPEGRQPADACPVHRFWSEVLGCHFYTTSERERDNLVINFSSIWTLEGVAWYAYLPQWDSGQALAIVRDRYAPDTRK